MFLLLFFTVPPLAFFIGFAPSCPLLWVPLVTLIFCVALCIYIETHPTETYADKVEREAREIREKEQRERWQKIQEQQAREQEQRERELHNEDWKIEEDDNEVMV